MAEEKPDNPCHVCGGTGQDGGKFCINCLGTGNMTSTGLHIFFKGLLDKIEALDTKMDTLETHLDTIEGKIDALEP